MCESVNKTAQLKPVNIKQLTDRPAELLVSEDEALQSYRKANVTTSNHVLDFEV